MTEWRPNEKQEEFLKLPDKVFEALYGGAAGPGKSEILTLIPILREFYKVPNFKGVIFRRTFPELEAEIIPRAQKYYPQTGGIWNSKTYTFKWPTYNTMIRFGHMEHDDSKKKYDGAEYQYAGFDELTHFTYSMYNYMMSRMRAVNVNVKPIMRAASNPGGVGHHWVRSRFIEPFRPGQKILRDPETDLLRFFLPANVSDNPHLLESDPDYVNKLKMLTPAERKAKLDGDWWTYQGQVFDFREVQKSGEPASAVHVIPQADFPEAWPRFLATDIGFTASNFSLWAAVSPDNEIFIYREHSDKGGLVSQWARDVGQLSRLENIRGWVVDHTVFEGDRGDVKLVDDIHRIAKLSVRPRKAPKGPGSRRTGMILLQEYLSWANMNYRPRLYITDNCKELIRCLPLCQYKKSKLDEEINDVAEFDGDDPYDTVRYLVRECDNFIKTREADTGHQEAKLQNLAFNQDWMSYFIHRETQRHRPRRRRYREL